MSIAVIVLAAGFSSRLGRPKQTVMLNGETLVERAVHVAQAAGFSPVIVVVSPENNFDHTLQKLGCHVVINPDSAQGMASSICSGVAEAKRLMLTGVLLMTSDQVKVSPQHLRALCEDSASIAGSGYAGKAGIPAYFPASSFYGLQQLRGDTGAREMLRTARVVANESLAFDIDTEEDLLRVREKGF